MRTGRRLKGQKINREFVKRVEDRGGQSKEIEAKQRIDEYKKRDPRSGSWGGINIFKKQGCEQHVRSDAISLWANQLKICPLDLTSNGHVPLSG